MSNNVSFRNNSAASPDTHVTERDATSESRHRVQILTLFELSRVLVRK